MLMPQVCDRPAGSRWWAVVQAGVYSALRSRSVCWRRSLPPPASSRDLLPFLEFAAARIASLHPAKLLERRPVTLEQRVFLVRRRRHAPAKRLTSGHCVRTPTLII